MISRLAPKFILALLIVSCASLFMSCGEDDATNASANDNLQGDWNASSFVIAGVESLGTINSALMLTFNSNGDESGTYQETITTIDGASSTRALSYQVLDNGGRIEIGSDTLDMSVSESNLMLDGTLQGAPFTVLANM